MLDEKDRKIVAELLLNSRISFTQLAKKVGVSREVAQYRVKRLEEEGVIRQYYLVLDYEALGFTRHNFFMQFKNVTGEEEQEILNHLATHKNVTYLGPIVGKWNCAFDLLVRNNQELKQIIQELRGYLGEKLASFVVYHGELEGEAYPTKFVGISRPVKLSAARSGRIDNFDKRILSLLATDARMEYKDLSVKLGKPANTIAFRVKRMMKNGSIQAATISVNYKKLGWESYDIQVKTKITDKLLSLIKNHPRAWYYFTYVGNEQWDLDIGFLAKSTGDLRNFLLELRQFPISHIHDIYLHDGITKDNLSPKVVFEEREK